MQFAFVPLAARASPWGLSPAYAASFVGFAIAGAPCWHLWTQCGVLGVAAASMFLTGMLAQLVASCLGARTLFISSAAPLSATCWSSRSPTSGRGADDNAVNRILVERFLAPLEADVTVVTDGLEAVEACSVKAFDVVLMDVQMPTLNGLEATRRIRASGGPNAATPVLALTADAFDDQRRACLEAGMNGHVSKPIDVRVLLTSITNAVLALRSAGAAPRLTS
jgi:CheY-like chemotaxis protein